MNKSISVVFLFFMVATVGFTQSKPLSRVYSIVNGNEYGIRVFVDNKDRGYITLNGGICDPGTGNSKRCRSILYLKNTGEINNIKIYVNRIGLTSKPLAIKDTIYVCGFNHFVTPYYWVIYKTNIYGDSLGEVIYDDFKDDKMFFSGFTTDGTNLYFVGGNSGKEIIVLKMDRQGNKIKEEKFLDIVDTKRYKTVEDIVKLTDGNFAIVVLTSIKGELQPMIIKFNKNLETIWSKKFEPITYINNYPDITAVEEGGMVMSWGIYLPDFIKETGKEEYWKYGKRPPTLYKIDKDGNTVWADTMWTLRENKKWPAPRNNIYMMTTARNGDIIGVGKYDNFEAGKTWGCIFRYNANGKKLWEKIYEDQNINESYSDFLDIMEAPNGDIVCTGQMTDDDVWGGNADYTWVLRVDSMGCFKPGCGVADSVQLVYTYSDLVTGTNEVVSDYSYQNGIIIYPNPASTEINVELPVENNIESKWNVFDIQGSKILSGTGDNIINIDVSILKAGLYYIRVIDNNGKIRVGKFVVE